MLKISVTLLSKPRLVLAASSFCLFLLMTALQLYSNSLQGWNVSCHQWLQTHHYTNLNTVLMSMTLMADDPIIILITAAVCYLMAAQAQWNNIIRFIATLGIGYSLMLSIKYGLQVPRPISMAGLGPYAYPSGHTLAATLTYGMLFLYCRPFLLKPFQHLLFMSILALVAGIAFSRVYFGFHWPADVFASLFLGIFILSVTRFTDTAKTPRRLILTILTTVIASIVYQVLVLPVSLHAIT
ncbi:MAG: phosphatase PAP2 family protein [Methylococcales bacterium]|jgi:membrane-associated phospholipid phosphatase|nr:phosphatase PAP2 family protein [Methylococcales bacterium]MBT7445199.1 phosphatase PAP2 family protein [Methylococcales bacterium]